MATEADKAKRFDERHPDIIVTDIIVDPNNRSIEVHGESVHINNPKKVWILLHMDYGSEINVKLGGGS